LSTLAMSIFGIGLFSAIDVQSRGRLA